MGQGVTSGLCMNGMNKPLATVDAVRRERVKVEAYHLTDYNGFTKWKILFIKSKYESKCDQGYY